MKQSVHSFNTEDANKYGVECAVLLFNIRHWLDKNVANEKNIHDGRVWTYNSTKAFAELFPYLSEKQIYRRLSKLEDEGILLTGNYNKHEYDRTKWYSLDETEYCISQERENHSPKSENGNSESGETIPDINTDINTDNILVQGDAFDEKDKIVDILEKVDLTKEPESNEEKYSLLALHIWNDVNELQPNNQTTLKAKIGSWYHPIRLMVEQDNRDVHGIWKIWKRAHRDEFWKKNVLSTQKLREQFDRLAIKFNLNDNKTYEIIDALYG